MILKMVRWFVSFRLPSVEKLMAGTIALLLNKVVEQNLDAGKLATIPIPSAANQST